MLHLSNVGTEYAGTHGCRAIVGPVSCRIGLIVSWPDGIKAPVLGFSFFVFSFVCVRCLLFVGFVL